MDFQFRKAVKERAKGRVALYGPSGSGKTFTALRLARGLGERVALIDTENGSASKYADVFEFSTLALDNHDPLNYVAAIQAAEQAGFDVVIIDSLSHAWTGRGGALEQVDRAQRGKGNTFTAWADVTPRHNALIDAITGSACHIIATMRSKTAYEVQQNERGKAVPKKLGLAPVQREGMEYEFDVTAMLDMEHYLLVDKSRCPALDGQSFHLAGEDVAAILADWLADGEAPAIKGRASAETTKKAQFIQRIVALQREITALDESVEHPSQQALEAKSLADLAELGKATLRFLQELQETESETAKLLEGDPA